MAIYRSRPTKQYKPTIYAETYNFGTTNGLSPTYYYDILNKKFSNQSTNTNQNLSDIF